MKVRLMAACVCNAVMCMCVCAIRNELCSDKIDSLNVKHFAYYFSQIDMSRRLYCTHTHTHIPIARMQRFIFYRRREAATLRGEQRRRGKKHAEIK